MKPKILLLNLVYGSMDENVALSKQAKDELYKEYGGTRLGRQELAGEILKTVEGAYWDRELIERIRAPLPSPFLTPPRAKPLTNDQLMGRAPLPTPQPPDAPYLVRTGIGFDPSVSKGNDECGIMTVSLYSDDKAYVRFDDSGQYTPGEWSKLINAKYKEYDASFVVIEVNQGGNTFDHILRSVNPYINIIPIHASKGKLTRAEHTSALYYQGKVFHTATFPELEDQMCSFSVNYSGSPDRLDALNVIITELMFPSAHKSNYQIENLPAWNK